MTVKKLSCPSISHRTQHYVFLKYTVSTDVRLFLLRTWQRVMHVVSRTCQIIITTIIWFERFEKNEYAHKKVNTSQAKRPNSIWHCFGRGFGVKNMELLC